MDILTLCDQIRMPEPMVKQVMEAWKTLCSDLQCLPLDLLMDGKSGWPGFQAVSQALGEDPIGAKQLACQLHCACLRYKTYRELGIPEQIYFDTMSCFTRFVAECLYYKGGYQFDRGWWTWRQLSMKVFRLGSLEYELRPEGTVSVHIPTGSDISPAAVDRSLMQAKSFLTRFFQDYAKAQFTCNSWLLSPTLGQLLSAESNILAFQRRFQLTEIDPDAKEYICWLFQRLPDSPVESFPENTSLQRKVKKWILNGGKIGSAAGYLKTDKE